MSLIDTKFTGSISTAYLMLIMKKLKILMALVQYDSVTTFEMTVKCYVCISAFCNHCRNLGGGGGGRDSCVGLGWGTNF